jgi:RsiW-degrading membrane proteinase PrsW (M82 family)
MRISEEARAHVRPRDFWLVVGIVTLALGSAGLYFIQTGHMPTMAPWMITTYHGFEAAFLLFIWAMFIYRSIGKSRRVYTRMTIVSLVACTLFFGSDLIPQLGRTAGWWQNVGIFLLMITMLPDWITFGKRRPSPL